MLVLTFPTRQQHVRQALLCFSPGALIRRQPWDWQGPLMRAQTCCGVTWTTWSASKATPSLSCTPSLLSSWLMLPCNHSRQVRPQPASDLRFLTLMLSLCCSVCQQGNAQPELHTEFALQLAHAALHPVALGTPSASSDLYLPVLTLSSCFSVC